MLYSLDRAEILGEIPVESLIWLNTMNNILPYAKMQEANGVEGYSDKVKQIEEKIEYLINNCPDICIYRERYINPECNI